MEFLHKFLSVVMHVFIAALLVVYLPISLVWTLFMWVFVRPFSKEDMRGKVVLITGASSGIGEQLAYQYARRGASMTLVARREQALQAVAKKARENGAPEVLVIAADISDPNASKQVVKETITRFGKLNHLVANAGVGMDSLFEEINNITEFTRVMDVNFWGSVYPTYYALPYLKQCRGKIIVNASMGGRVPVARISIYDASKAAVIMFYEALRSEVGSDVGITVVTVGYVESDMTKGKLLQSNGRVEINEDGRDIQVGLAPIASAKKCAEVMVDSACRGDKYVTWPSWFKPFPAVMSLAPELVVEFSHAVHVRNPKNALSKRLLDSWGLKKFLYPASVISASDPKKKTDEQMKVEKQS